VLIVGIENIRGLVAVVNGEQVAVLVIVVEGLGVYLLFLSNI
jgi:hypothetical protein